MNVRLFTGWLPTAAEEAWAPRTAEHGPLPRLVFAVRLKDSQGLEFEDKCVIDEPARIEEYRPLLTAGRAVIIQGEQTGREWRERGVLKGYVREVRIQRIEFPNRKAAAKPEAKPETEECGNQEGNGTETAAAQ